MQVFLVGGAVRDELLGRPVVDRDWVVVGAAAADMLAAGFHQKDPEFPVFLHPDTGDEYALARVEHKTSSGHRGFELRTGSDVTLEMDLSRRDLTVNAIARAADERLIAPHGGTSDLEQRRLKHVTPAFVDDPLRLLRLARFHAELGDYGFEIAEETEVLARRMASDRELESLSGTRIWQELKRALAAAAPGAFLDDLRRWGALSRLLPELDVSGAPADDSRLLRASEHGASPRLPIASIRLAAVFASGADSDVTSNAARAAALSKRLQLGRHERALLGCLASAPPRGITVAEPVLSWLEDIDALRQPERALAVIAVWAAVLPLDEAEIARLQRALSAARQARAPAHLPPNRETVRAARLAALDAALEANKREHEGSS